MFPHLLVVGDGNSGNPDPAGLGMRPSGEQSGGGMSSLLHRCPLLRHLPRNDTLDIGFVGRFRICQGFHYPIGGGGGFRSHWWDSMG